jgi:hypothetical protein
MVPLSGFVKNSSVMSWVLVLVVRSVQPGTYCVEILSYRSRCTVAMM